MKALCQISPFVMLFVITGCVTLYKPNTIQSPLPKEKCELHASASLGLSGSGLLNPGAAYALTDHAGLMVNGMYHHRNLGTIDSSDEKLNIFFGEAGAGYFTSFGSNKSGLFQCYSGVGLGSSSDRIDNPNTLSPEVNAKYYNLFIQPGLAFTNKNFEVAFDIRANYVCLYKIHAFMYDQFDFRNTNFQYHSDTSLSFINLEPTITIKAGGVRLKGILQLGTTIPTVHSKSYFDVNTASMLMLTD